jgi:glycosyltransferase involved in cell wall biosynthesis
MTQRNEKADGPSTQLVSLVMPAFSPHPAWLRTAVRSALGQQGWPVELIVVDDGSPEPVSELLGGVEDSRLRLVRVSHGGVAEARNAGIAAARGAYIRFVDADDFLDPDSTTRLATLIGGRAAVVAYGATLFCDEHLRPLFKLTAHRQGDAVIACLLDRFPAVLPAMLFPRRVVDATGSWDPQLTVCEDWDWVLRALEHARVLGERDVAAWYRRHLASASHLDRPAWDGAVRVVQRYFERHPDQRGTHVERSARAMLSFMRATHRPRREIWRSGYFWRAALLDPLAVAHGTAGLLREGRVGRFLYSPPSSSRPRPPRQDRPA